MTPKEAFQAAYALHLAQQHHKHPDQYLWPIEDLSKVCEKMMTALEKGSANIQSPTIKTACKTCHIPHKIKAIQAFLTSNQWPVT